MSERIIPIIDQRLQIPSLDLTSSERNFVRPEGLLLDQFQRPLHDLRISVTDRCNFRCIYCMPRAVFNADYPYLPHHDLLSFEEITRLASIFITLGVNKIRLTGGEPLLRKNLERLIAMLHQIPTNHPLDLTLTTNGALLAQKAHLLKEAGLNRLTVSLDALDDGIFKRMNDADFSVAEVLHGLEVAHQVGLGPIKINMVVKKGVNDSQIVPMARYFKNTPFTLRLIEYMDVGTSNGWKMDEVLPTESIVEQFQQAGEELQLIPLPPRYSGETARRWRYQDGIGEIGFISSVTQPFCTHCTRLRLSTEGKIYTCLFAGDGVDLRTLLRHQANDAQLTNVIAKVWTARTDRYSDLRSQQTQLEQKKVEMSYIGG